MTRAQACVRSLGLLRNVGSLRSCLTQAGSEVARTGARITGTSVPASFFALNLAKAHHVLPASFRSSTQQGLSFASSALDIGTSDSAASCEGGSGVQPASEDGEGVTSGGGDDGVIPHLGHQARAPPWAHASRAGHGLATAGAVRWTARHGASDVHTLSAPGDGRRRAFCSTTAAAAAAAVARAAAKRAREDFSAEGSSAAAALGRSGHHTPRGQRHGDSGGMPPADGAAGAGGGGAATPPTAARMSADEYRTAHDVRVDDLAEVPEPIQSFEEAGFPPAIMNVLRAATYTAPSPIQAQGWPIAMAGRDLVAIASTGSGKTLGYLLPALAQILTSGADPALGPVALVLAPTRELAQQIDQEARRFAAELPRGARLGRSHPGDRRAAPLAAGLRTACLYGGAPRGAQGRLLRSQPQLIIATPGRLLDFIHSGEAQLGQVSYLVLDEADRMLDMGFEPQISDIARNMPAGRQTLFFSATWPREVQKLAQRFAVQEPVHLFIGDVSAKPVAAATITQQVRLVQDKETKFVVLKRYLEEELQLQAGRNGGRAMVFCGSKSFCDSLALRINESTALQADSIHGDKTQGSRDYALRRFREGRLNVLVATDVAARGLDVPDVDAVVIYDMHPDPDQYVHRIGRTGRGGARGESLAIFSPKDAALAPALIQIMEGAGQVVPDELKHMAEAQRRRGGGGGDRWGGGRGRQGHHHNRWEARGSRGGRDRRDHFGGGYERRQSYGGEGGGRRAPHADRSNWRGHGHEHDRD